MFKQNFLHADVLCLENFSDYILAGIGNCLYVFSNGKLIGNKRIFQGERVHQIYVFDERIFIKGGKEIAQVKITGCTCKCEILRKVACSDWIQDILVFNEEECFVVTAHNMVELWDWKLGECKRKFICEEKCILYSGKLIGKCFDDLIVLAGTVFSDVVIWSPASKSGCESSVLHRLKGHNGVIFSIKVDIEQKVICTTSDDRTLRVWSVETENGITKRGDWENSSIRLMFTVFGHTARVWKSLVMKDFFISVGEDSKMCVWNKNGKLDKSILLHQSSGIRGLHFAEITKMLLTGGEDGGITMLNYDLLFKNYSAVKMKIIQGHNPSRLCFLKNNMISISDQGLLFLVESLKILTEEKDFANYCLLEVSKCKRYAALASIRGRVLIFDTELDLIVFDGRLMDGRIFSMHYLDDYLIICGLNGVIKIFKVNLPDVKEFKDFVLPESKERWSTCACAEGDFFIIGDRMGSVHVFKDEVRPVKSFVKIHGYLGVTSIVSNEEGRCIFTCGRDGTVKIFTITNEVEYLLNYKLPMEWIWRIVNYKDDKLILGFSSVYLIIYSLANREILVKFSCGGGHRSCDYRIIQNILQFIYIKEKNIFQVEFSLNNLKQLRTGFHTSVINCLKIIHGFIFSGSEDTTLRISVINNSDIKNLYVLENHISSIRAICICDINEHEKLIVSAGGRAQIAVWKFNLKNLKIKEIETMRLKNDTSQEINFDPETRIMCLDGIKCDKKFLVVAGCSDCKIRIFSLETRLVLMDEIDYSNCVLKISWMKTENNLMILSFATDGKIVFWEFDDKKLKGKKLDFLQIHQSGINSFGLKELDRNLFLLATGGDDNLLAINIIKIERNVEVLKSWKSTNTHSCQITGILLKNEYLLTTSIDQRLTVWRCEAKKNNISMEFIGQYLSPVPDIQGMEIYDIAQGKISICVYGKGIEIVDVNLPALK